MHSTAQHVTLRRREGALPPLPWLLRALRRWWTVGRHYRPERRYMRGGLVRQCTVGGNGR
jgi:hypothetical protein